MFKCSRVVVQAPAKVNLSLDILGEDGQGYHRLETVMQTVDLCDVAVIGRRWGEGIRVTCSRPGVPEDDSNLAHRAARAFFAASGMPEQPLAIHIDKAIPMQAGLAGGSADAAAVLVGLNRLFEANHPVETLCEIGRQIGSDVPFCVRGGTRLARGRGEILLPLPRLPDCRIAIAKPPRGMSTRRAFQLYDRAAGTVGHPDTAAMLDALETGDLRRIGGAMCNIFELLGAVEEEAPLREIMLRDGAVGAVMSGSGSAVIGLFAAETEGKRCLAHLEEQVEEAWLSAPVDRGARVIHTG